MRSLTLKLTLAFLFVSLAGIVLAAALMWSITSIEFNRFLTDRGLSTFETMVTNYYTEHGSWKGITTDLQKQNLSIANNPAPAPQQRPGPALNNNLRADHLPPPPPYVLINPQGGVVAATGRFQAGDQVPQNIVQQKLPVKVKNQVVGYILVTGRAPSPDPIEARFLLHTNQALILAALGGAALAVLLGLLLARTITRPVRDLTYAASALAAGKLNQQVQVRSKDELGELTRAFNKMSADLDHANQLRKQMTADIAHDLRTPLAVISGYLEGLKDGIIKPSPKRFTAMYDEARYLQRLVEDLRTLSLADAGELSINRQPVQPRELVERLVNAFQNQAEKNQVALKASVEAGLPEIQMDPERMQQALGNLVSNALRYTPAGGEISIRARREADALLLEVTDTGSGISAEALPHIFERFYRADEARQESGSGLGLAITRSLVELQGGTITAESAGEGKGSRFTVAFALKER